MQKASLFLIMASLALLATATGCAKRRMAMPPIENPHPTPAEVMQSPAEKDAAAAPETVAKPVVKPVSTGWSRVKKALRSDDAKPPAGAKPAAANQPKNEPRLLVVLAQMHERSGNQLGAREQYERALQADPDYVEARVGLARLYDRQGNFAEANKQYAEAARRHPNNATVQNDLGLCYLRQNKPAEAVAALGRAVKLRPDRKLYRSNLSTALVQVGRADDAVHELTVVNPPAVAHYNVGFLLQQAGQNDAARRQFIKALEYDPSFTQAQYWVQKLSMADNGGPALGQPTQSGAGQTPTRDISPSNVGPRYESRGRVGQP